MDSTKLSYFIAVSETGSVRKAAEILRLSPAALSKAIKQLEDEVGFDLMTPSGRGIVITDRGRRLAQKAKPLLDGLSGLAVHVRDHYRDLNLATAPIRIGSFEVFTTYFLADVFRHLPSGESDRLLLRELVPGEMERALVDQQIDYGITYIPIPTAGVEHHQVSHIEMGIFGTKTMIQKSGTLEFSKVPFVIPVQPISGSPNKVQGLDGWPEDKIFRHVKYRVTLMESALEICRQGHAVCYLPTFIVQLHNELVKAKYQLEMLKSPKGLGEQKQAVFLARRKSDDESDTFKRLAKSLRLAGKSV